LGEARTHRAGDHRLTEQPVVARWRLRALELRKPLRCAGPAEQRHHILLLELVMQHNEDVGAHVVEQPACARGLDSHEAGRQLRKGGQLVQREEAEDAEVLHLRATTGLHARRRVQLHFDPRVAEMEHAGPRREGRLQPRLQAGQEGRAAGQRDGRVLGRF
jgi:hypothetical protein